MAAGDQRSASAGDRHAGQYAVDDGVGGHALELSFGPDPDAVPRVGRATAWTSSGVTKLRPESQAQALAAFSSMVAPRVETPNDTEGAWRVARTRLTMYAWTTGSTLMAAASSSGQAQDFGIGHRPHPRRTKVMRIQPGVRPVKLLINGDQYIMYVVIRVWMQLNYW